MSALSKTAIAAVCGLLLFVGGIWLGGHPERLPDPARGALVDDDRAVRAEILDSIEDDFYKTTNKADIQQSSLKGIVDGLGDQFSHYLTPEEAKQFKQSVQGEFEGVGISVEEDSRGLRVTRTFEGSPAEKAEINEGDLITAVDGRPLVGVSRDVAITRIKGEAGTKVELEVLDPDEGAPRTVELTRAKIEVPVAEGRIRQVDGTEYGVVALTTFSEGAHGEVREQLDRLLEKGAEGIVLDLRGNGGGLLREAVLVSSQFIEDGLITYTKGRARPRREFDAEGDAIDGDIPVVVLVDRGSASASEIVTGALRDTERATVVGTRTFGKGVFQEVETLSNGGVLDITVGQYFLPSGENIGKKGVVPTVKASDDPETDRDEALRKALRTLADEAAAP
jgi:carboxyl-terminal processing protease